MIQRLLSEISSIVGADSYKIRKIEEVLSKYEIKPIDKQIIISNNDLLKLASMFAVSKKMQGLSEKSISLYIMILKNFINTVNKELDKITATDIRLYLYNYQESHKISNRTLDMRRVVISSFFSWLTQEEYITKNPALRVNPIKHERKHKQAMTQMDLEIIRNSCKTPKELAIIEMLFSTGCRVSELVNLNIKDVNFQTKEVVLFGKGNKHRLSFLNAKAEVSLKEYLNLRKDDNTALFVSDRKPYDRIKKSGIEAIVRRIVERSPDISTHVTPHIFRHTTATVALNRGMEVTEVSKLLGHAKIETTMEYITSSTENIKNKHKSCII